jgi:hypothetical protein
MIEPGDVIEAAVRRLTLDHPELVATIDLEVEAAVSGHLISRTIVGGQMVAGEEVCRGP